MQTLFNQNLKYLRKKNKQSQYKLAELLKISVQTISGWETNKNTPAIEKFFEISQIYNVTIDDLLKKDLAKEGETPTNSQTSMMSNPLKSSYEILLEDAIKKECPKLAKRLNL